MASIQNLRLDGGGARSFSQLEIMGAIMHQLKWDTYPNDPDKVMLPCEHFDLLGGSDTGGLIAIMFAKLRMSVEEVSDEFFTIFEKVYKKDDLTASDRTKKLKECLEGLLTRKGLSLDLKMVEEKQEGRCAGFVIASYRVNVASRVRLRTYPVRTQPSSAITVIDALLATCAMQPRFTPVSSGMGYEKGEYIGAGFGASNPVREVISEAHSLFGANSSVSFLLSLGTGHPGNIFFPLDGEAARYMMMNSQQVAEEIHQQIGRIGIYFRFSVEQGIQGDRPGQVDDLSWIASPTKGYLIQSETSEKLDICVKTLVARIGLITLDQLRYTGGPKAVYKRAPMLATHYVRRRGPWNSVINGITGRGHVQTIMIVAGMAGCGKTQLITDLVLEFGSEQNPNYEYVFFVDGSSESSIEGGLIGHVKLALPGSSQIDLKDAMSFFQNRGNSKWLIAFDNVDDINLDFRRFIPQCNQGTIVVTTRNQALGLLASEPHLHLKLDVMSKEEAVEVVLRCARIALPSNKEREAVAVIANKLGYLPVALSQAGCYMYESTCSANTYIKLFDKHRPQMMDKPSSDRQKDCAYATFDISYHRLPKALKNVVHLLSFFHFANFPVGIIAHAAKVYFRLEPFPLERRGSRFEESIRLLHETFLPDGAWSDLTLPEMARLLQNYSIISITSTPNTDFWRIHPLLREWAFDQLDNRGVFRDAACRLVVRDNTDTHLMLYMPPHIESIMARSVDYPICANDSIAMATTLRRMDQHLLAQKVIVPIYNSFREKYGPEALKVATISLQLAATWGSGSLEKEKLESDAMRIRETMLGPNHIDTLQAKLYLSQTLFHQDKLLASGSLLGDVVKGLSTQSGDTHLQSLYVMHFLSRIHRKQRRFVEAESLQIKVVEGYKTQVGHMHPYTLVAMADQARIYSDQGRYSDAEDLYVKVLEGHRITQGETHTDTITATLDLLVTYCLQDRYSDAEDLQVKALEVLKTQIGRDHHQTLTFMLNILHTLLEHKRYSDAEILASKMLEICRASRGDEHLDTLTAISSLACVYHRQGRYPESELLNSKVLEVCKKTRLGSDEPDTIATMSLLAWNYYDQGRYAEAEALDIKILDARTAQLGDEHPDTLTAMGNLGWTYHDQGRYAESEALEVKVLNARRV